MLYARRRPEPIPVGTPGYEFLDTGLAFGCGAIRGAAAQGVDALFIDEIGPLEMGGGGLWEALEEALAVFSGRLILTVRPSLLDALVARLEAGGDETEIVRL
jgi:nucleoside-triphosphatase THEP1